jgi:peptidyl-prolyl cis-trans isomerase B (cyclophilin B)
MNKIQISIFLAIILIFGIIFYITQAKYLGLNTPPKGQVTISQIPDQMNFNTSNQNQTQQQAQQSQQNAVQNQQQAPADSSDLAQYQVASATAIIKTSKGDITLVLYGSETPTTVANFIKKAKTGFYDNLTFHRVEDWVVQGGDPLGSGTGGGSIPVEFNDKPFVAGSLGQASKGDGKVQNDAQFFITKTDSQHLNGQYTNYGMVTEGMDVVNSIQIGDKILEITIK